MIKKLSQFLEEFESHKINEDGYSDWEKDQDELDFQEKFKKFKDFLNGKQDTSGESQISSSPREFEVASGSFSDVNKMIDLVVKYLNKHGITNSFVQRAILATIGKESGFISTKEVSYKNTPASRIKQVFGNRFDGLSDEEINQIKKNDSQFWERAYGGEWGRKNLGNIQPGDGAKYVGRGFNGITGRSNYQTYTDMLRKAGTNVDLVANPEILEKNPEISAEVNALYFLRGLSSPLIKRKYGNTDPNDFQNFDTALKAVVNANAGAATDITRGFAKQSYDAAVAANSKFGSKFDRAISEQPGSTTA
jgi:putative chitinase